MKVVENSLEMMFNHPSSILKLGDKVELGDALKPCVKCCLCCVSRTLLVIVYLEYFLDLLVHGCNVLEFWNEHKTIPSHMLGSIPVTASLDKLVSSSGYELQECLGISVSLVFWWSTLYLGSIPLFQIGLLDIGLVFCDESTHILQDILHHMKSIYCLNRMSKDISYDILHSSCHIHRDFFNYTPLFITRKLPYEVDNIGGLNPWKYSN